MRFGVGVVLLASCGRMSFDSIDAGTIDGSVDAPTDTMLPCDAPPLCAGTARFTTCSGRCVGYCAEEVLQPEALSRCTQWGGSLQVHRDASDVGCMLALNEELVETWIGYTQAGGQGMPGDGWSWLDGQSWPAPPWAVFEPNDVDNAENEDEQCAILYKTGEANDLTCTGAARAFICAR